MRPRRPTPIVLLSYFTPRGLLTLVDAVADSALQGHARVLIGTYGASERTSEIVHSVPGALYAPMFPIEPSVFWRRRRLRPDEAIILPGDAWDGPLPSWRGLMRLGTDRRVDWGIELGRRFRDGLRRGGPAERWQLDELLPSVATSRRAREFVRGVLRGLTVGRPRLGDRPLAGFVWTPLLALRVAAAPVDQELERFWLRLEQATFRLVGEEYPPFVGDPAAAARASARAQHVLSGGPIRRALGRRYAAGMTPGHYLGRGLGGNVARRPRRQVNTWRREYIEERLRLGIADLAEYNFRHANSSPAVMRDVIRGLAAAIGRSA